MNEDTFNTTIRNFLKKVGIRGVRYEARNQMVKITLSKPIKGAVQVRIQLGRMAADGASNRSAFSIIVP